MKFKSQRRREVTGSVLVMTLLIMGILGFVLGSYLLLLQSQNVSVARAQSWNEGIAVAEAGVEEALAHLNKTSVYFTPPNMASDGWTPSGNYVVAPRRYIGSNFYDVVILTGTNPVIYATGYTTVPISQKVVSRTLRVDTAPEPLFTGLMVALTNIDLSGSGIETDSYDSSDPNYSTNGNYDPAKARDHGDLVTNSKSTDKNRPAMGLGNGLIRGHVRTGPGGLITMNSGSVGDTAWVNGGTLGIKPGWQDDDVSLSLPDVSPPFSTGLPPSFEKDNKLPDITLGTGDYYLSSLKLSGTSKTNIVVTGNARLYVAGDFIVNGYIAVQPGASLQLFVGDTSTASQTSTALGTVYSPNAMSFQYYGLPNNTSVTYNGGNDFKAIMYAPRASMKLGGGGSTTSSTNLYDFQGTYLVNSMSMNGHFKFHYDENISKVVQVWRGYIATRWQEL